ncbi:MAG: hypothetical protein SGBAC_012496 [Bacillariaceae sp.]
MTSQPLLHYYDYDKSTPRDGLSSAQSSPEMLSSAVIHKHIEDVITELNPRLKTEGWSLNRFVLTPKDNAYPAHFYGMVLHEPVNSKTFVKITFYIAYSTWDGRCLHVDQLPPREKNTVKGVLLLQILGKVAIKLGCRRLLWMQTGDPDWSFVNLIKDTTSTTTTESSATIKPETLDEWLLLKMDRNAMESYAGSQQDSPVEAKTAIALDRLAIETKIQKVCADLQSSSSSSTNLVWRLVVENNNNNDSQMEKDANSIFKMVQGLAEYENEPDAVQCRSKDYQLDGSGPHPLFYCLLLEDTTKRNTCGMAFFYFGYNNKDGRFLYLEDLYLEPAYRRKGGGTLALKSLAKIGISLECSHLLWTALDWNQPALNLYSKMGAVVQDGLKISRYKDDELHRFANANIAIK